MVPKTERDALEEDYTSDNVLGAPFEVGAGPGYMVQM